VLELGVRAAQGLEVRRLAQPALRALMEDTGETACLAVRDRDDLVVEPAGLDRRSRPPVRSSSAAWGCGDCRH
jgi:DNA-binding IclR family transcriptional regulator